MPTTGASEKNPTALLRDSEKGGLQHIERIYLAPLL